MDQKEIKEYIEKLKEFEKGLLSNEENDIEFDENFIGELDSLLNSLSTDIQKTYLPTQNVLNVKIKKLDENAVIPKYAKIGDAGMDLTATSKSFDGDGNVIYGTGLAIEIPKGYVGFLFPRSSNAKKMLTLTNSVGVIDSGYRGEIMLKFKPLPTFTTNNVDYSVFDYVYEVGERIGQIIIMPYPQIEFIETDELSDTERGDGGFGHTGN